MGMNWLDILKSNDSDKTVVIETTSSKAKSDEHRQKISESKIGKPRSEETRRKISEYNKTKKLSEEHKRKIGDKHRGKKQTEEAKKRMSEAKGVAVHTPDGVFSSQKAAAKHYGIQPASVRRRIKSANFTEWYVK